MRTYYFLLFFIIHENKSLIHREGFTGLDGIPLSTVIVFIKQGLQYIISCKHLILSWCDYNRWLRLRLSQQLSSKYN